MNRRLEVLSGPVTAIQRRLLPVTRQSERTLMLSTILLASALSLATGYFLTQCLSVDVLSSLLWVPQDCWLNWGMNIGRHCFSDYPTVVEDGLRPNPWAPSPLLLPWNNYQPMGSTYPAAAMLPHLLFGLPAKWLGAPLLGLIGYLLALTVAVCSPAVWAARGTRGLERVVVFVALGAAAIPAWAVVDRGNSVGFAVPIALVFLVALRQRRWSLVAVMVVLAALVKPQFAIFAVALFAARQWRLGGFAIGGVAISNFGAYLLWPRDFPETITQSIHNMSYISNYFPGLIDLRNVSFGRALLLFPDMAKAAQSGRIPDGFLAGPRSLIGYAILAVIVVAVLALGRRIPPVMVGIVLLAGAALSPGLTMFYYVVFVLPVAALVVRDPEGPPGAGIFDRLASRDGRRRAVGVCVSLAAALSIAQVGVPGQMNPIPIFGQLGARGVIGTTPTVLTTEGLAPLLWLLACAVIVVSYARRPAHSDSSDQDPAEEGPPNAGVSTSSPASELMTESSPQAPR
nr:glycosyltransferase family 87 protein [Mycobacterium sp. 4858]